MTLSTRHPTDWAFIGRAVSVGVVSCAALACGDLTHVAAPDVTTSSNLNTPAGAMEKRAGAISAFANASSEQVFYSGLITDEFVNVDAVSYGGDQRVITTSGEGYPYADLSTARINALEAIHGLRLYNPVPAWLRAELYAYVGFVEVFFAENMCSGIPVGVVTNGTASVGPTLTRGPLLQLAIAHFDTAMALADSSSADSIRYFAAVGQGRALLDNGSIQQAATAVSVVPTTYQFAIQFGGAVANGANYVQEFIVNNLNVSVADREGQNGLNFVSGGDPRVPTDSVGVGQLGTTIRGFIPYSSYTAPIVIASGVESRLMEAEALLATGDAADWVGKLNSLRQSFGDTALSNHPLGADSTTNAPASEQVDVMFRERAMWLFATGHRQGDLRRLIRGYGRQKETVFPTGKYILGLNYGPDVAYIPIGENYNPNYHGCDPSVP